MLAVSWLMYRLTNSAFMLGIAGFITQIPIFILSPFAGILADRWNRKDIVVVTQTLAMLQALTLAVLTMTGVVQVWHLLGLSFFNGVINAFDMPVRQAFVFDMVEDRKDLSNAIALNSLLFNSARMIGSSLAGIVIAAWGEGICFLLNAVSFLAIIVGLLMMRVKPVNAIANEKDIIKDLKEGFRYAFGFLPIRYILLFISLASIIGMPCLLLMPIFAKDIFRGGSHTLGFLMGTMGLGALMGAIYLASKKEVRGFGKIISQAAAIFGIALIAFSFSRIPWLSYVLMVCVGFGTMVQIVACNTVVQSVTADDKRGRVMGFYIIAFIGMTPFGSLLAGSMASKVGAPATLCVSGIACILGAIFFMVKVGGLRKIENFARSAL